MANDFAMYFVSLVDLLIIGAIKCVIHVSTEFLRDCRLFLATLSFFEKHKCTMTSLFSSLVIIFFEVMNTVLQSFIYVCFISDLTCAFIGSWANKVCNIYQYPDHSVL